MPKMQGNIDSAIKGSLLERASRLSQPPTMTKSSELLQIDDAGLVVIGGDVGFTPGYLEHVGNVVEPGHALPSSLRSWERT